MAAHAPAFSPPIPNDPGRLEALARSGIMDTPPEQAFDDLVSLAALICHTPVAIISFLDGRRQWFKAKVGVKAEETPIQAATCAYTIAQSDPLVVPDAQLDPRFAGHPLVAGPPHFRFYAGVPLITADGHALGALCVIDTVPHQLAPEQIAALSALGRQVMTQITLRQQVRDIETTARLGRAADESAQLAEMTIRRVFDASPYMMGIIELLPDGDVLHKGDNLASTRYIGALPGSTTGKRSSELGIPRDFINFWARKYRESRALNAPVTFEFENTFENNKRWMIATVVPLESPEGGQQRFAYFSEDITARREAEAVLKSVLTHAQCILYQSDIELVDGTRIWHTVISDENAAQRVLPLLVGNDTTYNAAWMRSWLNRDQKDIERRANAAFASGAGVIRNEFSCRNRYGKEQWLLEDIYIEKVDATHWRATGVATDITAYKAGQRKLEDALSLQHAILNATPYIVIATDERGFFREFNAAGERALGYTAAEVIGNTAPSILHDPAEVIAFNKEVAADFGVAVPMNMDVIRIEADHGRIHDRDWTFIRKDGSRFPVHLTIAPIRDSLGSMRGFVGIAQDITESRRAQEALAKSEERLKFALEATEEALWDWDLRTDVMFFSPRLINFLGYSESEFPKSRAGWRALVHPDELPNNTAHIVKHLEGKTPHFEFEHRIRRKDGRYVWILCRAKVVQRDPDTGEPIRVVGTHMDVTHRRQNRAALDEIRERLELAIAGGDLGSWDWNVTTNVSIFNDRWATMLGWRVDEIEPHVSTWERLVHPDDKERAWAALYEHFEGKTEQYAVELRMLTSSGDYKWILTRGRVSRRDADGKPLRVAGTHLDIDDRKRAEAALEKARLAAQAASQAKSDFLANMSHEIRTPMTAIVGFADLLADPALASSTRVECVARIRRNAEHLLNLLNDMLDVSKIEAGKFVVDPLPCSPVAIVRDVAAMMRERASRKGLLLETRFVAPIPKTIHTDPTRVRQVLVNLIGNAIKFTENGHILITVQLLRDHASAGPIDLSTPQKLSIAIEDTGIGMRPDQFARLFEPFMQADTSITRKHGGTGLGLTISRRLALLLGGDITATSTYLHGSTFTFTLDTGSLADDWADLSQPEPMLPLPAPSVVGEPLHAHILVAEDGPDNRDLINFYLTRAGATVESAVNGKVAIDMANAARDAGKPYDLIIMDIHMPELDGFTATRILKSHPPCPPIIALTANTMRGDREKCLEAGCDDFAGKPIDADSLLATLRKHLKNQSPVSNSQPPAEGASSTGNWKLETGNYPPPHPQLLTAELRPLVDKFVHRLPARVAALEQALAANDLNLLVALAHQLKGAAGGYGFNALAAHAATLESLAQTSVPPGDLHAALSRLRTALPT